MLASTDHVDGLDSNMSAKIAKLHPCIVIVCTSWPSVCLRKCQAICRSESLYIVTFTLISRSGLIRQPPIATFYPQILKC